MFWHRQLGSDGRRSLIGFKNSVYVCCVRVNKVSEADDLKH
jgi:hypothetical protein